MKNTYLFFFLAAVIILSSCSMGKSTVPFPSEKHPNIIEWPDELFGYFNSADLEMLDVANAFADLTGESIDGDDLMEKDKSKPVQNLILVEKVNDDLISISKVKAIHESMIPFKDEENEIQFDFFSPKHLLVDDSSFDEGKIYTFSKKNEYYLFDESHVMFLDAKKSIVYGIDLNFMSFTGNNYIDANTTPFLLKKKDKTYFLNFIENEEGKESVYLPIFIEPTDKGYIISVLDEELVEGDYRLRNDDFEEKDVTTMTDEEYEAHTKKSEAMKIFTPNNPAAIKEVIEERVFRKDVLLIEPFVF